MQYLYQNFHGSAKLRASHAHVSRCLVCLCPHVLTYLACLHSHLRTCLACLRAHVSTCLTCLFSHMLTCFACSRAKMPCMLACLHTNMPCVPTGSHSITSNNKNSFQWHVFFNFLVLCLCLLSYEMKLHIKSASRNVSRNIYLWI